MGADGVNGIGGALASTEHAETAMAIAAVERTEQTDCVVRPFTCDPFVVVANRGQTRHLIASAGLTKTAIHTIELH